MKEKSFAMQHRRCCGINISLRFRDGWFYLHCHRTSPLSYAQGGRCLPAGCLVAVASG